MWSWLRLKSLSTRLKAELRTRTPSVGPIPGIGFVWPKSFTRAMRHNSLLTKYLPFVRSGEELALFRTHWPGVTTWAVLPALAHSGLHWKLASFGAIAPSVAGASGHAVWHLSRPVQGKLGSFGAMSPSGGSADAFAGPRPSPPVSANWVCLYNRSQRRFGQRSRPSPPVPFDVGIGFVSHAFVRSIACTRIGLVFPRPKAVLQTVPARPWDLCASGRDLRRGHVLGRSRRNPPKLWSLACGLLFCCYIIMHKHQFCFK